MPDPRQERACTAHCAAPGLPVQRLGERELRSRGLTGGRGRTVPTSECTVSAAEIAILIKGSEARVTFISPDLHLSAEGKGQEGAPRNREGACGEGLLMRGTGTSRELIFRASCTGAGVCLGGVRAWTPKA